MTGNDIINPAPSASTTSPAAHRRLRRLGGIGVTVVVTLAVWVLGRIAGADYTLRDPSASVVIGPGTTAVVTLVVAVLGWLSLAVLERLTRHPSRIWMALAAAVLTASMVPIFFVDATPATQLALFLVHIAVAVLVPTLLWARRT